MHSRKTLYLISRSRILQYGWLNIKHKNTKTDPETHMRSEEQYHFPEIILVIVTGILVQHRKFRNKDFIQNIKQHNDIIL